MIQRLAPVLRKALGHPDKGPNLNVRLKERSGTAFVFEVRGTTDTVLARVDTDPDTEEPVVIIAVSGIDTGDEYQVVFSVTDAAGNESNEVEVSVP